MALADPAGGSLICHNDIELSNVVFRDGVAVAIIDFEFAAPGRPVYDLAQFARLCVPIEHEIDQARMGWAPADRPARMRLIADRYGLDRNGRAELVDAIEDALEQVEKAARTSSHVVSSMVASLGGLEKYDRRRQWWERHRDLFVEALR